MKKTLKVIRIVADVHASPPVSAKAFYQDILGLKLHLDMGWVRTLGTNDRMEVEISFGVAPDEHMQVPDLSIEVNDVNMAFDRFQAAGYEVEYGLADESWGVRRFFVRDPFGKLVNIFSTIA